MDLKVLVLNSETLEKPIPKSVKSPNIQLLEESLSSISKTENPVSPNIRKSMPQTSMLLASARHKVKKSDSSLEDGEEGSINDHEIECMVLPGMKKIIVSKDLRVLITDILSVFPQCKFKQDTFKTHSDIYKYLFDSGLNRVRAAHEFYKSPEFLIISERYKINAKDFGLPDIKNRENKETKSYQFIDMYGSVMTLKKSLSSITTHKAPLYVLKKVPTQTDTLKNIDMAEEEEKSKIHVARIIPSLVGKKVVQGAGGFKKPLLIFDKHKNNPLSEKNLAKIVANDKKLPKIPMTPRLFKEIMNIKEICIKYGMTKKEFMNMVEEYNFLKGNNKGVKAEAIAKAYSLNFNLFRGVDPRFLLMKNVSWEDFLKFYMIIVMRKAGFAESLEFIFNYLGISTVEQLRSVEFKESNAISALFNEKFLKIVQVFQNNKHLVHILSHESIRALQKAYITVNEIRAMIGLITSSAA